MLTVSAPSAARVGGAAAGRSTGPVLATGQGLFYAATGVWPLLDIDSFQAVTGAKTDLWLVYTVGVLVTVVGLVLLSAAAARRLTPEVVGLAVGVAVALAGIDVAFVARGVISSVYLLDAAVEGLLVAGWVGWLTVGRGGPR